MTKKLLDFFTLIGFEIKKLSRSPIVFICVIFGPLIMALIMCGFINNTATLLKQADIESGQTTYSSYFMTNVEYIKIGNGDITELENNLKNILAVDEIEWGTDYEKACYDLQTEKIYLIITINPDNEQCPVVINYNTNNIISNAMVEKATTLRDRYQYIAVKDFLDDYGITLNDKSFFFAEFSNIIDSNNFTYSMLNMFSVVLVLILALGISYLSARDNETGIIKQLSYTPMPAQKYLLVRIVFFMALGILQILSIIGIFSIFGLKLYCTFFGLVGLLSLYLLAFVLMALLFSNSKNQISAICLSFAFVIIPFIMATIQPLNSLNIVFQIIFSLSPITILTQCYYTYAFFGILELKWIIMLLAQIIVYYLATLMILKKRTGQQIFHKRKVSSKKQCV